MRSGRAKAKPPKDAKLPLSESASGAVSRVSTEAPKKKKKASTLPQPRAKSSEEHRILVGLLTELREATPYSQRALSVQLGKAKSHWGIVESCGRDLTFVEVAKFCEVIGVPLDEVASRFMERVAFARKKLS